MNCNFLALKLLVFEKKIRYLHTQKTTACPKGCARTLKALLFNQPFIKKNYNDND